MNRSNGSHVYVENVEPFTEGTYSCEINTDEPFFMSVQAQQDLRVYGEYAIASWLLADHLRLGCIIRWPVSL